jgi:hypothetical protein
MKVEEKKEELVCKYKGRTYILLYQGKTKTGRDGAFLMFFDGTRKFWCDLTDISDIEPKRNGEDAASPKEKADKNRHTMFISDNEAAVLVNAVNSEITVYRNVSLKKTTLGTDKKLAQEKLKVLLKLKEKLAKL